MFNRIAATLLTASLTLGSGAALAADTITGAGATFPYPVYSKWADAYQDETGVGLNYQAIGSGGGIKQIVARTVTFGASDAPMTAADLQKNGLMQWPMVMGGVVPVVNLPGLEKGALHLDGATLADIYAGKISNWNAAPIAQLNPGLSLPDLAITPVYRAEGSGTNFLFTHYLSQVSKSFAETVGEGQSVAWPAGVGAKANAGVAGQVAQTNGAIGYVEFAYAQQNKLAFVTMKNHAGQYVQPSIDSFKAAAANADWKNAPGLYLVLTDQPGAQSWPITGASYILMPLKVENNADALRALKFFDWAYSKGSDMAEKLDYVPMPDSVVEMVRSTWKSIKGSDGQVIWK